MSLARVAKILSAALLAAATVLPTASFAAPAAPSVSAADPLVVQVRGCHRDPERHFDPRLGRTAWHVHRGDRCRAVEVPPPFVDPGGGRDCHRDVRRHRVRGAGEVWHYHRPGSCRVVIVDRPDPGPGPGGDCHRDVRRHRLPGIGDVWHSHRPGSCRPVIYDRHDRPRPGAGGACIGSGDFFFCLRP